MITFDSAKYKTEVVKPISSSKYAKVLADALAEMKRPDVSRPSALDLAFLYQVTPSIPDAELSAWLNNVLKCWNNEFQKTKNAQAKQAADRVRQLHELLVRKNPQFTTQTWWSASLAEKKMAAQAIIAKLSAALGHTSYAALGSITDDRLSAIAASDGSFAALDASDRISAAAKAGINVVKAAEIPDDSGLGVNAYAQLKSALADAVQPSIVHAVFAKNPPPAFGLLDNSETGKPLRFKAAGFPALDLVRVVAALGETDKSSAPDVTARGRALSSLKSAAEKGADLSTVALFHLADQAAQMCSSGVLHLAYEHLVSIGLNKTDAARIVLSIDTATEARVKDTPESVRALLADGALQDASDALTRLESTAHPDAAAIRVEFTTQRAKVDELRRAAAASTRRMDIPSARAALTEAIRLDRDNDELPRDLASLPPEPPASVSVGSFVDSASGETQVRVSWQPGLGSDADTRFKVVRKLGSAPGDVGDGDAVGDARSGPIIDTKPPAVELVHYSVFATRGKAYSMPTSASITVLPPVARLTLSATPTGIGGHWVNPARASEILVTQIDANGTRTRIPLSNPTSFLSEGLTQGAKYRFEVQVRYLSRSGSVVAAEPVVAEAIPRTEAKPVPTLTVKPAVSADGTCGVVAQWSRQHAHEVQLWSFPQPPPWSYGTRVSAEALRGKGSQVRGHVADKTSVSTLTGDVPSGLLYYTVVTVAGDDRVIGQSSELGICAPVGNPRAERYGDEVVLSWDWPSADYSVRAVWSGPSTSGQDTISKTRYDQRGGMRIRVGAGHSEIRLTTFIEHAEGDWLSPMRSVSVTSASAIIRYSITWQKKMFGGAPGFDVTVTTDSSVSSGDLVVGYRADRVMPNSLKRVEEIERYPLRLAAGESVTYHVALPKMPKQYWVRCFLDGAEGIRIIDPPTDDLRGR